jgi:hypothetical protein
VRTAALPWFCYAVVAGATSIVIGILWDISWLRAIGRDTLWTPAHLTIYLGGLLGGLTGGLAGVENNLGGGARRKSRGRALLGLLRPAGRRSLHPAFARSIFFLALVGLGKRRWDSEDADYRNNRLFRPLEASAKTTGQNSQRRLRLNIAAESCRRAANYPPLVPGHGKLMHLFLVREPLMDAFAPRHPVMVDRLTFESALPDLPAGNYCVYANVTLESGFTHTLTTSEQIPEAPRKSGPNPSDLIPTIHGK